MIGKKLTFYAIWRFFDLKKRQEHTWIVFHLKGDIQPMLIGTNIVQVTYLSPRYTCGIYLGNYILNPLGT